MKKIGLIALLCALVISVAVSCGDKSDDIPSDIPQKPVATEGLIYLNSDGGCKVIGYKGSDTDIIIPDEYGGLKVVAIGNSAFAGNEKITSITLGNNVKKIESAAFAGCKSLVSAELGDAVEEIGSAAFFGCESIKTVSVSAVLKKIAIDAFSACDGIEEINYNGNQSMWSRVSVGLNNEVFNTKLVLADGGALVQLIDKGECNANISWRLGYDGILIITGNGHIPDYEFGKLPWGEYTDQIIEIVVEEGIDIVGKNAFLGCNNTTSVTLAPSVRLIDDNAFYGCAALSEITLPERLRRIGNNAFFGCSALKSVIIPETVTAIGSGAFMGCEALEKVTLPTALTTVERWCFANCTELKNINLDNVTEIGTNAFFRCMYIPAKYLN